MMSNVSVEKLPTGWTVQFNVLKTGRKIKHYVNTGTGQKFFSKDEVMRYIRMHSTKFDQPQPTYRPIRRHSKNGLMRLANSTHKYPEWLPHGWIMELKTRNSGLRSGEVYKCYMDPSTGFRFYSKPGVLCYLKTVKQKGCTSKKERSVSLHTTSKVMIEKSIDEDLPLGWIKEVKVRQDTKRIRRDPYYMDPVHGYVFRSKMAVQRYLKAGGVNRKASKKIHINGKTSQVPAAKRQKLKHLDNTQPLVQEELTDVGNQSSGAGNVACAKTEALGKRRGKKVSTETTLFGSDRAGVPLENCPQDGMFNKDTVSEKNSSVTPEADTPKQKSLGIGMKRGNKIETQSSPSKSSNKNGLNLSLRSSKRLAGIEPELVDSSASSAQAETMFPRSTMSQIAIEKFQKKHMIDSGTESKDKYNTNSSALLNANVSERDQGKKVCSSSGPLSSRKPPNVSCQSNIKKGLNLPLRSSKRLAGLDPELVANSGSTTRAETMIPVAPISFVAIEKCPKDHMIDNGTESKDKSNTSCSALLNADVSETYQGKKVCSSHGPVLTHKVEIMQEHNSHYSGTERSRKTQHISCKSNIKKGLSLPCRSSKRLTGLESEQVANSGSTLQALQNATRPCKREAILEVGLTSDGLAADASLQLEAEPGRAISNCASGANNPFHSELSMKSQKAFHDQVAPKEMEIDKADDEKAEPQLIPLIKEFLSDPCIEFAFKTLTGAIAVENAADNGLLSTTHADIMKKSPLANKIGNRSNKQTVINSSKSMTQKELSLHNCSSKWFSGLQLEPQASSTSNKFASQIGVRKSGKREAILGRVSSPEGLADRVSHHLKGGHEAKHAHYGSAVLNTTSQKEPSGKGKEPIDHAVIKEKSQKLEIGKMNSDKAEQQPAFLFADYWSDPCLEFAFKTLTGAIPVQDCLLMQGYFQQQVDASQTQREDYCQQNNNTSQALKDGGLALPDFGLSGFFHTDISAHFDDQDKQPASQPHFLLNSPSFLPSGSVNLPSRSSIGSQQPHLEGKKASSGKVTP